MQVAVSVLLHSMVTLWRRLGHAFPFTFARVGWRVAYVWLKCCSMYGVSVLLGSGSWPRSRLLRSKCCAFPKRKNNIGKRNDRRDIDVGSLTLGSGTGLRTSLLRTCSYCCHRSHRFQARSRRRHWNRSPRCSMLHCRWYSICQEMSAPGCFARCCPGRRGPRV